MPSTQRPIVILLALAVLLPACSNSGTAAGSDGAGAMDMDMDTVEPPTDFAGGEFQLAVRNVDDACLDGGLDLLFMPEGTATPYDLQNPTYIAGWSELPKTYTMKLQAPFSDMEITMVSDGGTGMKIVDAMQQGVVLAVPGSDDCSAEIRFDAELRVLTASSIEVDTRATLSGLTSPTDSCPVLESDPCTVALDMIGTRL